MEARQTTAEGGTPLKAVGGRIRKRARVVEWAALEKRYGGNSIGGSNPPASANLIQNCLQGRFCSFILERKTPDFSPMLSACTRFNARMWTWQANIATHPIPPIAVCITLFGLPNIARKCSVAILA